VLYLTPTLEDFKKLTALLLDISRNSPCSVVGIMDWKSGH
jgi:hypothetical protein